MIINKQPIEYVLREVDKLYEKQFKETDIKEIDNHINFIKIFINSCGYTEEEYLQMMLGVFNKWSN